MPARTVGRITTRAAFVELQRSRCRGASGPVRAVFVPAEEQDQGVFPQVGFAVSRQCGGAVVRNRLRRRMREVARQCAPDLPRGRYLLRLDAAAAQTPPAAFRAHVAEALHRAAGSARSLAAQSASDPSSVTR